MNIARNNISHKWKFWSVDLGCSYFAQLSCAHNLNYVIEAIRSHRKLWGEWHLPPCHLIMVPGFTTSFSIREIRLPLALLLTLGKTLASPASPWALSSPPLGNSLPLLLQDSHKQGRENFHFQESVHHTYLLDVTPPFFQFPPDINLKSINPVVSKALTPCSLSSFELEKFSFKYSWGK